LPRFGAFFVLKETAFRCFILEPVPDVPLVRLWGSIGTRIPIWENIRIQNNRAHHLFLMASFEKQGKLSQSSLDMCEAFNAADIPLSKLSNPVFRAWLERETKLNVPHESTLRKQYLLQYG
jgi:hypothetical protein